MIKTSLQFPAIAILVVVVATTAARAQFVDWTNTSTASVGAVSLTMTGLTDGPELSLSSYDLTDAPFIAFPGAGDQPCLNFLCSDDWTASFGASLGDLKLYAIAWRGLDGGATPVQYTFNRSFSILCGLGGASVNGSTLSLPDGSFYNGILQFNGSFNSLSVTSTATLDNAQAMTFHAANVPEPQSPFIAVLAAATLLRIRRRLRA